MSEIAYPERFTRKEAAGYLGLSEATLAQDIVTRRHKIPYQKLGRRCVYPRDLLDKWLAAHTVNMPAGGGSEE